MALPTPVDFLYEHFGYWAAVRIVPALGLVCSAVFARKLRRLGRQAPA